MFATEPLVPREIRCKAAQGWKPARSRCKAPGEIRRKTPVRFLRGIPSKSDESPPKKQNTPYSSGVPTTLISGCLTQMRRLTWEEKQNALWRMCCKWSVFQMRLRTKPAILFFCLLPYMTNVACDFSQKNAALRVRRLQLDTLHGSAPCHISKLSGIPSCLTCASLAAAAPLRPAGT